MSPQESTRVPSPRFEDKIDALGSPVATPRNLKAERPRRDEIRIVQTKVRDPNPPMVQVPIITQSEIDEKVRVSITATLAGFLDRARGELMKEVQTRLKVVDLISSKIDGKIEREFVERLFNNFRAVITELKTKIEDVQSTFMGWITREELQQVLERFAESLAEIKDTAGGSSKYKCLLCGQPRTHVSGMIMHNTGMFEDDMQMEGEQVIIVPKPRPNSPVFAKAKRSIVPPPRNVLQLLTPDGG
jgi:hypothetical protein